VPFIDMLSTLKRFVYVSVDFSCDLRTVDLAVNSDLAVTGLDTSLSTLLSQPICAVSVLIGCYRLHPPSPFITTSSTGQRLLLSPNVQKCRIIHIIVMQSLSLYII